MGSAKIKKKATASTPSSLMPRQGAIPCLIIIILGLLVLSLIVFFSLRSAG
jgi:hypothetical protein